MAKKLRLMSLFQELNGRAQMTNRRPTPTATGIYLMQLRAQAGAIALPRRRLMISVELGKTQALPHPVKINHRRTGDITAKVTKTEATAAASLKVNVSQVQPKAD